MQSAPNDATAARPVAGKRMLVVEEALKSESGHFFEYVKSVAELNQAAGAQTIVVTHRDATAKVREALDAHAIFPWTNWDNVYAHPKAWRRYLGIAQHNWRVFRLMDQFVREHGPFDIVFAPTVVIYHIFGWRLLMISQGRQIGKIVLLFRNNAGAYPPGARTPVFKRSTNVLRWALRSFRGLLARGRARFVTDSSKLACEYEHLCGIKPEVLPSPRIAPPPPLAEEGHTADSPVVFSCLGPTRFEKGIDLMQEAIKAFLTAHPQTRARFVIQWNEPITDEKGEPYLPDRAIATDPRVRLITQAMRSEEYDAAIHETDCMLLPYRRASYFARISGVAVEAATAGMPLIYTKDTWCEDLVRECGVGIGVPDGDAAALAEAIAEMAARYPEYRARARARAEEARRSHSPASFTEKLWA